MRERLALVTAALLLSPTVFADTYPRQRAVDAIHYRFALTFTDALDRLDGEAIATIRVISPVEHIELDLTSLTAGKGMTVRQVTSDNGPVTFVHENNRLRISVPPGTQAADDVVYTIRYGGAPAASLKPRLTLHGDPSAFSDNWPDQVRHWLPMIDHPYDKATGELIVTAPAQYQVVSNGTLVEEVDVADGRRRTHWKQSVPIPSWLYAIGIAKFDVHYVGAVRGVPLQTWLFPRDREPGRQLFEQTSRRAMEFFSDRIGPYPYEKLANVQAAGISGGMENATVIFYGEKGVASGQAPVVHEIAHQWFGNSVTEHDWDHIWLSEGFATYLTHLYTEHFDGRDAFVADLRQSRTTIVDLEGKMPDTPVIHRNLGDMARVLNQLVYQKGAWILHMLRAEVGAETFWRGLRLYYERFRDRNASTDDFRQVMEQVSGKALEGFFDQWLTRGGIPRLEGKWRYDTTKRAIDVTLTQTQPGPPFGVSVEIAFLDAAGTVDGIHRVSFDSASHSVSLPVGKAPATAVLDPNTWLLAEIGDFSSSR
jgi:aminopeptidase N